MGYNSIAEYYNLAKSSKTKNKRTLPYFIIGLSFIGLLLCLIWAIAIGLEAVIAFFITIGGLSYISKYHTNLIIKLEISITKIGQKIVKTINKNID